MSGLRLRSRAEAYADMYCIGVMSRSDCDLKAVR